MTDYYAKLGFDYEGTHANDGLSPANAWGGPSGVQRAITEAGEHDTIYAINSPDWLMNKPLTTLYRMEVVSTTNIDPGDLLENLTSSGEMRIAAVGSDYVLGEIVSGDFDPGETVTPDGGTTTTTVTDYDRPMGLQIDDFFAADNVTLRGVASNGVTAQHAYFDCDSDCTGMKNFACTGWTVAYLHFDTPGSYGVYKDPVTVGSSRWLFDHVKVTNPGYAGFTWLYYLQYARMRFCEVGGAASYGYRTMPLFGRSEFCIAGNCGVGVYEHRGKLDGWLIVDNIGDGVGNVSSNAELINCTIDGNGGDGIGFTTTPDGVTLLRNRITNNGGYGLSLSAYGDGWLIAGNVWFGNASGTADNVTVGVTDHGPVGDTDIPTAANRDVTADGYTDQPAGDYSLLPAAVNRRIENAVGDDNTAYVTSGLAPDDAVRGVTGVFGIHGVM